MKIYAPLFLAAVLLTGCDSALTFLAGEEVSAPGEKVLSISNWHGQNANSATPQFIVARGEQEWQALWRLAQAPVPGKLPGGKMAIGIFTGQKQTGGYGVDVVELKELERLGEPERLQVFYEESSPPEGVMLTQALTSPWVIRVTDMYGSTPEYIRK